MHVPFVKTLVQVRGGVRDLSLVVDVAVALGVLFRHHRQRLYHYRPGSKL